MIQGEKIKRIERFWTSQNDVNLFFPYRIRIKEQVAEICQLFVSKTQDQQIFQLKTIFVGGQNKMTRELQVKINFLNKEMQRKMLLGKGEEKESNV